jgi:hypothetical protein
MTFKQLVDKCFDRNFYDRLKKDPQAALEHEQIDNKEKVIKALKGFNYKSIDDIAQLCGEKFT